ncbi:MAG: hypothetical protein JWM71_2424, partial [Solirubrobacteraceae bacterium]|nr:hypothetical protein [Solirubrobacteraceae bacterium]
PATALEEMLAAADDAAYGLGIYRVELDGVPYYGHDGSYAGWESYALSSPSSGMTFVALAHGGGAGGPDRAVRALAHVVLTGASGP